MTEEEWTGLLSEQEWCTSKNADDLITHLIMSGRLRTNEGDRRAERKLRLFGVACCRATQRWNNLPAIKDAIEAGEMFADEQLDWETLDRHRTYTEEIGYPAYEISKADFNTSALRFARAVSLITRFDDGWAYHQHITEALYQILSRSPATKEDEENDESFSALLRDIFGNPFRPVNLNPSWLTPKVLALATGIYEEKAFDRMPILADALGDAGCSNEDILQHCRRPAPHTRGCFCVDLILGKS